MRKFKVLRSSVRVTADQKINNKVPWNKIHEDFAESMPVDSSLAEFAKHTGVDGKPFYCAIYNGERTPENFVEANLISVDFDNKPHCGKSLLPFEITLEEALQRCKDIGIYPNFAYHSFSSNVPDKEGKIVEKFRFIFLLNEPCKDYDKWCTFMKLLRVILFPEADKASNDPARVWFGGKGLIGEIHDEYSIDVDSFDLYLSNYAYSKSSRNAAKSLTSLLDKQIVKLNCFNGLSLPKLEEISPEIYAKILELQLGMQNAGRPLYIRNPALCIPTDLDQNYTKPSEEELANYERIKKNTKFNNFSSILFNECNLIGDLEAGKKLNYDNWKAVCTNLFQTSGGEEYVKETLKNKQVASGVHKPDKIKEINALFYGIKKNSIKPTSCAKADCPYIDTCKKRGSNILSLIGHKGMERVYRDTTYNATVISQDEARSILPTMIDYSLATETKSIIGLRASTGLGKTHYILELFRQGKLDGVIVIVPTSAILDEIAYVLNIERGISRDGCFISLPEPDLLYPDLNRKRQERHLTNIESNRELYEEAKARANDPEFSKKIDDFLEQHEKMVFNKTIFTTHARFLTMNDLSKHHTIIIDEDFDNSFVQTHVIPTQDVNNLLIHIDSKLSLLKKDSEKHQELISTYEAIRGFVNQLKARNVKEYNTVKKVSEPKFTKEVWNNLLYDVNSKTTLNSKLPELFRASYFIRNTRDDVLFSVKNPISTEHKVIILSATITEEIFKLQYGNDAMFLEVPEVKLEGTIQQYSEYTWSRASIDEMKKNNTLEANVLKEIGFNGDTTGIYYITFNDEKESLSDIFKNAEFSTFGANLGLNRFSGKSGVIVGTPYPSPALVKLLYATYTDDIKKVNSRDEMPEKNQTICRNGFCSKMKLFENETLKSIQCYLIEKELYQSLGRSRLYSPDSKDVVLYLLSSYPISQAKIKN